MKKFAALLPLLLFMFTLGAVAQTKIAPQLQPALERALQEDGTVHALIVLEDRVDIRALDRELTARNATLAERAYTVITRLQQKAAETQGELLALLERRKAAGEVISYQPLWLANLIAVETRPAAVYELSRRSDVAYLQLNSVLEADRPVHTAPAPQSVPNGAEPGLRAINAHLMWQAGYTGDGVIVMNIDTGVNGSHPALSANWRGNVAPAEQAWFDPETNTTTPNDCDGHGSHTIGTMCGVDPATNDTIGVAPDAQWIAAKTICTGGHTSRTLSAMQWALDPDGNPSTTDDMPVAIGNSWLDPSITDECDPALNPYIDAVNALEAAGIAVVFSAGNSGPGISTITAPKNVNQDIVSFWATGAVDGNNPAYPIASFSSRGPVTGDCTTGIPSLDIKPEASAPGVSVRSAGLGTAYNALSGTSMACPHVVGALALLRQAHPEKTGHELKQALYFSAVDLGPAGEDNEYGMGIIDVWAAHQMLISEDEPNLLTTPTSVDFGFLIAGKSRDTVRVTLRNIGGLTLSINDISAPAAPFQLANMPPLPAEVAQFSTISFDVIAAPSDTGTFGGAVTISSNDPDTPALEIPLSATAIVQPDAFIWNPINQRSVTEMLARAGKKNGHPLTAAEAEKALTEVQENVAAIGAALAANDLSFLEGAALPDLSGYQVLFVILGHYNTNFIISAGSAEAQAIEDFIAAGGKVYLEGGDVWYWDPQQAGGHDFGPTFGITALSDGSNGSSLSTIIGSDFLTGYDFNYAGNDNWTDQLQPVGSGITLHSNENPAFICGIANPAASVAGGKTIGVSFQFKDLVDGTPPATKAELMAAYLAFFGIGGEQSLSLTLDSGWNLVSLPLIVPDPHYQALFPNATGPPFRFDGTYQSASELQNGPGYWVNLPAAEVVTITGTPLDESTLNLNEGWNLVGGPACSVPVSAIDDPGQIIQEPVFGFDGAYVAVTTLEPGKGYWINAAGDGTVTLSCGTTAPAQHRHPALLKSDPPAPPEAATIEIRDAAGHSQQLWFAPTPLPETARSAYRLPPRPPLSGNVLDARFPGDRRLSSGAEAEIHLQAGAYPLRLQVRNLVTETAQIWILREMVGNEITSEHVIREGQEIELRDARVQRLVLVQTAGTAGPDNRPLQFEVAQNYPNPFNPGTTIEIALPEASSVKLEIFDISGRKMRTLVSGNLPAGRHQIAWDGRNDAGQPVSSGIYLYRLAAGAHTAVKKMMLLR